MRETYVPKAYLAQLIAQAKDAGCNTRSILEQLNLSPEKIAAKQDISARQYGEIYRLVMRATQNEWFGMFSGGGRVPLGSFRMMGLTLLQCSNLQQAIYRAGDFAEICRGMNTRNFLERTETKATLSIAPIRSVSQDQFAAMARDAEADAIMTSLLTWHRFSEWLIDKEIQLEQVSLAFPEEELKTPLVHANLRNVRFNQPKTCVVYDAHYLDHPIVQNQDSLLAFLRTAPYHLVTQDQAHTSPADKVRSIINRDVSGAMPSAEQVAFMLNVSVTTLRRQLQRENTSFQRLKDECRMEAAFHFLNYAELSNNDIAEKLGFDEPSAFFRSFKKWTGMTPGEYRTSLK